MVGLSFCYDDGAALARDVSFFTSVGDVILHVLSNDSVVAQLAGNVPHAALLVSKVAGKMIVELVGEQRVVPAVFADDESLGTLRRAKKVPNELSGMV